MPDFTDTTDTTGAPETSDSTDASNINSIYDQDPSTWDLDTRSTAAIGDLYDMVGNHVDTYGEMPDQQTIDGFNNTVNQRWGLPDPNAPYPSQTDGGAVQPLPATINDPNDNAGSVASMADAAAAQTGEQPDDAAENDTTTDQPQDQSGDQPQPAPDSDGVDAPQPPVQPAVDLGPQPSTQPSKPANPKLAATDTGTMSDATNDIRNPATLNQRAQASAAQQEVAGPPAPPPANPQPPPQSVTPPAPPPVTIIPSATPAPNSTGPDRQQQGGTVGATINTNNGYGVGGTYDTNTHGYNGSVSGPGPGKTTVDGTVSGGDNGVNSVGGGIKVPGTDGSSTGVDASRNQDGSFKVGVSHTTDGGTTYEGSFGMDSSSKNPQIILGITKHF